MTIITFDVECIGSDTPDVFAEIASGIKPPGNIKKPESLEKWEKEDKPDLVAEAVKKTCFDGALGKIVCIGWASNKEMTVSLQGSNEKAIINGFFGDVMEISREHYKKTGATPITFVGHNITGFDLRFLWQRAVVLGIKPPSCIPFKAKPWDASIADTMQMWDSDKSRKISLERLCKALGVTSPKSGMDGSKVWDYVREGRLNEVAEYCRGDVEAVRECYYRMTFGG